MKSGNAILNFNGLYGDTNPALVPDFIHCESLATRSKLFDWEIEEHLHSTIFQLFYIKDGMGQLISENKEFNLRGPCIVTVPVHVLHGFAFHPDVVGDVISISESFLESTFKNYQQVLANILQLKVYSFDQGDEANSELEFLKRKIMEETHGEDTQKLALQPLLQVFFISLYRSMKSNDADEITSSNPGLRIMRDFQKILRRTIQQRLTVNEYARQLNITGVHLNRVCHTVAGKSALNYIHEMMADEAKKYLLNTNYSVSEIGYLLNFSDPAHFSKLFKKIVGVTPTQFRE